MNARNKIVLFATFIFILSDVGHSDAGYPNSIQPENDVQYDRIFANNVELAHNAFKLYNPLIADSTAINFVRITKNYGLFDEHTFRKCIGQICLESKAKQSAFSKGNAMGMGQIVPTTAFDVLNKMSDDDRVHMRSLGATSIGWAKNGKYTVVTNEDGTQRRFISSTLRKQAMTWLSNETNNPVLWAHIMSKMASKRGFDYALLAYRLGKGGAKDYEYPAQDHPYLKEIYHIAKKLRKNEKGVN